MKRYILPKEGMQAVPRIIEVALDLGNLYHWHFWYDGERYPDYLSMANQADDALITIDDGEIWLETLYGRGFGFPRQIPESELIETIKKYSD